MSSPRKRISELAVAVVVLAALIATERPAAATPVPNTKVCKTNAQGMQICATPEVSDVDGLLNVTIEATGTNVSAEAHYVGSTLVAGTYDNTADPVVQVVSPDGTFGHLYGPIDPGAASGIGTARVFVTTAMGFQLSAVSVNFAWEFSTGVAAAVVKPSSPFTLKPPLVSWHATRRPTWIKNYDLRYRRAPDSAGFGPWTYPASWQGLTGTSLTDSGVARGATYCYSVRARDRAGNTSAWSAGKCTAMPLDDRDLTASASWTRVRGGTYWHSTSTNTSTHGATLSRPGVHLDRLALLAEQCPSCGTVGLYVGSTQIARVNLAAPTTKFRALISLPSFSPRVGTVTLKVLSSGKPVRIDGLGISSA